MSNQVMNAPIKDDILGEYIDDEIKMMLEEELELLHYFKRQILDLEIGKDEEENE